MSIATALIKTIIEEENLDVWANLKKSYLPHELHNIYSIISSHVDKYHKLPTFKDLSFSVRDQSTLDKISLIEKEPVEDTEAFYLLDYLKSDFVSKEAIYELENFIDSSFTHSSAEETLEALYGAISRVESKVDLVKDRDSIERVELFESEEEMAKNFRLGLNTEYDEKFIFPNDSFILLGGYRGSGKSIVCNNIAESVKNSGKSVIKFTFEMQLRQELQRQCAISTGIPHLKIRYKELTVQEWEKVAHWWGSRYENGLELYEEVYKKERDFSKFHSLLIKNPLKPPVIDIVHTPTLTLAKFKAETLKRLNKYENVGAVILDYMNKMKINDRSDNKWEWTEQIQVADGIKTFAEDIGLPIISPFQTKADGEVKYSKDILVPADAAFNLHAGEDYMEFENIKMRHMTEEGFVSRMSWHNLQVGPETAIKVDAEDEEAQEVT